MPRPAKGPRLWFDKSAGRWFVRDGSSKLGTGCTLEQRAAAERCLANYIAEKHDPLKTNRAAAISVASVLAFYHRERLPSIVSQPSTIAGLKALHGFWRGKHLTDIRRSTCEAYIAHRVASQIGNAKHAKALERRVSPATAARELATLRAAVRAFHGEVTLDMVPVVYVPPPSPARTRWLTRDEAARFLRAARKLDNGPAGHALIRFILIGLYTGTRSAAIRALKWSPHAAGGWIDLERGVIHRRGEMEAETKKRKPPVRIPRRLRHALARWHRMDGSKRGFVIHYGGGPMVTQRGAWDVALEAAGLGKDVTGHILRHTAVTWMLQAGVKPWDVAHYTGMSVQVLEETYAHHHPEYQAEAADKVGRRVPVGFQSGQKQADPKKTNDDGNLTPNEE